jgi:hypothetical protein
MDTDHQTTDEARQFQRVVEELKQLADKLDRLDRELKETDLELSGPDDRPVRF